MATDQLIDPAQATASEAPPPPETPEPAPAATEDVEALKAKLAAAESEAATWKGRVEKKNEKKKDTPVTSTDLDTLEWKLANKDRIALVNDEYEKIRVDGYMGEKVSDRIALELAEKQARIDTSGAKRDRQHDMTVSSVTNRTVNPTGYETEADRVLDLSQEKKRKLEERHPHLKAD